VSQVAALPDGRATAPNAALPPDVRKGFAFPSTVFHDCLRLRVCIGEAQPRQDLGDPYGKAKPFRTSGGRATIDGFDLEWQRLRNIFGNSNCAEFG